MLAIHIKLVKGYGAFEDIATINIAIVLPSVTACSLAGIVWHICRWVGFPTEDSWKRCRALAVRLYCSQSITRHIIAWRVLAGIPHAAMLGCEGGGGERR
jgi:hypothetical protein